MQRQMLFALKGYEFQQNQWVITAIQIADAGFMIVGFCRCTEGKIFLLIPLGKALLP